MISIFKKKKHAQITRARLINSSNTHFSPWGGSAYDNDIYRSGLDAIARNIAKLKGTHYADGEPNHESRLNRLLQLSPNITITGYDLLYKIVTHMFLYNNAFVFIHRDDETGRICGLYPLGAASVDLMQDQGGHFFCNFIFKTGKTYTLPYADIIHVRRNFNSNDVLGDSNGALHPALELAHTQNQGILHSIKNAPNIRGLLKFTQLTAPEKMKEEKDRFIADYLSLENQGGIVATNTAATFEPLSSNTVNIDTEQMKAVQDKIFNYLGISEAIVKSDYSEDQWAAFYESVIEPVAIQLSLEFTRKIFTERERAHSNFIQFDAGRLQFSSNTTKVNLIKELMPYGLLTVNQALEILNLPGVQDGDRRLQTLNVVDAEHANKYQLGSKI